MSFCSPSPPFADDKDGLFDEWLPEVKTWAARQNKISDIDAAESEAVAALHRAVNAWPGTVPFRAYLRRAVLNSWTDWVRREARHGHVRLSDGRDMPDCGIDRDILNAMDTEEVPLSEPGLFGKRARRERKRFRGGDSVVVQEVIQHEVAEALQAGLAEAMRVLGYPQEEIEAAVRRDRRRHQQHERRQQHKDAEEFNSLFMAG